MKTALVTSLLILATLFGMAPANAIAHDASPTVELRYKLPVPRIQIEGAQGTGIRTIAREIDNQVDGLKIFRRGTCAQRPGAVCLRVKYGHYGKEAAPWYAAAFFPKPMLRVIKVNLDHPHYNDYAVMAHEFGHIVGLHHHAQEGVVGATPDVIHFSPEEVRVLQAAYNR